MVRSLVFGTALGALVGAVVGLDWHTPKAHAEAAPAPRDPSRYEELAVTGFEPALVALPKTGDPAPIAVAVHGRFDRAERICAITRGLVDASMFVLCPRGVASREQPGTFDFPDEEAFEREVTAGVSALTEKYGGRVTSGPALFAGFSRGAHYGVPFAAKRGGDFPRVLLIEGGHDRWKADAERFDATGGERVLFACGTPACDSDAARASTLLEARGVAVKVVRAEGQGHDLGVPIKDAIWSERAWLLEGRNGT